MQTVEEYFHATLFIMLYKVVLTFESVDEILKHDHSNESISAVPSHAAVYLSVYYTIKFVFFFQEFLLLPLLAVKRLKLVSSHEIDSTRYIAGQNLANAGKKKH